MWRPISQRRLPHLAPDLNAPSRKSWRNVGMCRRGRLAAIRNRQHVALVHALQGTAATALWLLGRLGQGLSKLSRTFVMGETFHRTKKHARHTGRGDRSHGRGSSGVSATGTDPLKTAVDFRTKYQPPVSSNQPESGKRAYESALRRLTIWVIRCDDHQRLRGRAPYPQNISMMTSGGESRRGKAYLPLPCGRVP